MANAKQRQAAQKNGRIDRENDLHQYQQQYQQRQQMRAEAKRKEINPKAAGFTAEQKNQAKREIARNRETMEKFEQKMRAMRQNSHRQYGIADLNGATGVGPTWETARAQYAVSKDKVRRKSETKDRLQKAFHRATK